MRFEVPFLSFYMKNAATVFQTIPRLLSCTPLPKEIKSNRGLQNTSQQALPPEASCSVFHSCFNAQSYIELAFQHVTASPPQPRASSCDTNTIRYALGIAPSFLNGFANGEP